MSDRYQWRHRSLHININKVRMSITLEGSSYPAVYNFDLAGRPWNIYKHGRIHQRGLDGKVVAKWSDKQKGRGRRWLTESEAEQLVKEANELALSLLADIRNEKLSLKVPLGNSLIRPLEAAASFSTERARLEVKHFHELYTPVGILPPDQYQAVLLQATEGCSFNACTFCEFYKGRRFHIKSAESFEAHARAVHDFLGAGLSLRRTIFLGDANALVIPTNQMLRLMEIAGNVFDVDTLGGFYAFLDGFSGEKKSEHDYALLRAAGLERVYIGLETGHEPLLRYLNKPGRARDALHAVRKMKAGGVPVGIIILLGAGGEQFANGHVEDTARLINKMKLDMDDQIYFSELIESEGMPYAQDAFLDEIKPLTSSSALQQAESIKSRLKHSLRRGTPHISRYDIREFVY
ncbi:MAG: radical SAM protein [Anaerolineales bacterium]|jgi:hypothetical protein